MLRDNFVQENTRRTDNLFSSAANIMRKRVVPDIYPLDDVVYLWANSPPFVNPVEVSNDLLSGPITFEEASAGDCLGNFTVGKLLQVKGRFVECLYIMLQLLTVTHQQRNSFSPKSGPSLLEFKK
ncbi:hypothetical protein ANCCAN_24199 [Ancylostoma caninum]|uniref:Uncharacterized protein n=1 Tax=Ancylostoma caninum TaxID=29170 RepID=A0A368FD08_ANCCA|nr:hypothetical protein ANCCAN_24199 [Ancylostoma caninum]